MSSALLYALSVTAAPCQLSQGESQGQNWNKRRQEAAYSDGYFEKSKYLIQKACSHKLFERRQI